MAYIVKHEVDCEYCGDETFVYEVYGEPFDVLEDVREKAVFVDIPFEDLLYEDDDKLKELYEGSRIPQ